VRTCLSTTPPSDRLRSLHHRNGQPTYRVTGHSSTRDRSSRSLTTPSYSTHVSDTGSRPLGPNIPTKYETFRRLQVTVSDNHLTQVRVSIPHDLFSNVNGNIQYYSIIVYQDGGFPDKPERHNSNVHDQWPPVMRTWAEAAPYPFILAYQTTPDRWMPFKSQLAARVERARVTFIRRAFRVDQEDAVYNIGADKTCPKNVEKMYCNGPLRPVTNYRLKLRAFTANGFQDSWTVPFTTRKYGDNVRSVR